MPTFETAEAVCFAEKRESWRSHGPTNGWRRAMDRYVLPKLGAMPVAKVGSAAVYEVLRPIALAGKHVTVQVAGATKPAKSHRVALSRQALDVLQNSGGGDRYRHPPRMYGGGPAHDAVVPARLRAPHRHRMMRVANRTGSPRT